MTAASYRTSNGDLVAAVVVLNATSGVPSEGLAVQGVVAGTPLPVSSVYPAAGAVAGTAGVVTAVAASSLILKASQCMLYELYATSTVAGWLLVFNAATAPADGTVTPVHAIPVAANGWVSIPPTSLPELFTTGCVVVFSSTGPFTKTASATAFIHGIVK